MIKLDLKHYVNENPQYIEVIPSKLYPGLSMLRYRKTVHILNEWNDFIENCRSMVVDENYNIIVNPFKKFFNIRTEKNAPRFHGNRKIVAFKKLNGFMIAVSWYNCDVIVSTLDPLDSEFTKAAKRLVTPYLSFLRQTCSEVTHCTFIFECITRQQSLITGDLAGLHLLAVRINHFDSEINTETIERFAIRDFHCYVAERYQGTISSLMKKVKIEQHRGYVVYDEKYTKYTYHAHLFGKIKTDYYANS
jgi:hypothetical protein